MYATQCQERFSTQKLTGHRRSLHRMKDSEVFRHGLGTEYQTPKTPQYFQFHITYPNLPNTCCRPPQPRFTLQLPFYTVFHAASYSTLTCFASQHETALALRSQNPSIDLVHNHHDTPSCSVSYIFPDYSSDTLWRNIRSPCKRPISSPSLSITLTHADQVPGCHRNHTQHRTWRIDETEYPALTFHLQLRFRR